jgi:tRNA nucleotidyltransferase (CCA-adding enzyme)
MELISTHIRWLADAPIEVVLALMAVMVRPELRKAIGDFLSAKGRVRPFLRGDDLLGLGIRPGPIYRDILNSLLYARLDGHVQSRDDELRFVRRRFARAFGGAIDKTGGIGYGFQIIRTHERSPCSTSPRSKRW